MFEKGKAAHEDRYSFSLKATCPVSDWFLLAPLACVNHPGELAGLGAFVLPGFTHDMNQGNTFAMFFPPFTIVSCSTILCKNPTRPCPKPQLNSRWFSPSCKHALHQHVLENCSSAPHLPAWSRPNHVPISSWGSCELWLRVPILSIPSRSREGNSPQQTGEKSFFLLFSSLSSKTLWVRAALPLPEQYSGFGTRASSALKDTDKGNGWSGAPQTCWPVLGCHYFNHKEAVWNKAKQNQKANPSKN